MQGEHRDLRSVQRASGVATELLAVDSLTKYAGGAVLDNFQIRLLAAEEGAISADVAPEPASAALLIVASTAAVAVARQRAQDKTRG